MRSRSNRFGVYLGAFFLVMCLCARSAVCQTPPTWPGGNWRALQRGNNAFLGDTSADQTNWHDIVGNQQYPAAFWQHSQSFVYFRMRVDRSGQGKNNASWQWPLYVDETDQPGPQDVDWVVEVREKAGIVELAPVAPGDTWGDVQIGNEQGWYTDDIEDYRRWVGPTGDGSSFDQDADVFLDAAVPWSEFTTLTGVEDGEPFRINFSTSKSDNAIDRDSPEQGFSEPVATPEPGLGVLLIILSAVLVCRRPEKRG